MIIMLIMIILKESNHLTDVTDGVHHTVVVHHVLEVKKGAPSLTKQYNVLDLSIHLQMMMLILWYTVIVHNIPAVKKIHFLWLCKNTQNIVNVRICLETNSM